MVVYHQWHPNFWGMNPNMPNLIEKNRQLYSSIKGVYIESLMM